LNEEHPHTSFLSLRGTSLEERLPCSALKNAGASIRLEDFVSPLFFSIYSCSLGYRPVEIE
jgi:hypothetical protein